MLSVGSPERNLYLTSLLHTVIVSKRPALGEGLKKLLKQKLFCILATTSYEETDADFMVGLEPGIVIFDRPDITVKSFDYLFQTQEQLSALRLLGEKTMT